MVLLELIFQLIRMVNLNKLKFHSQSLFRNKKSIYFRNLVKIQNAMILESVNLSFTEKSSDDARKI